MSVPLAYIRLMRPMVGILMGFIAVSSAILATPHAINIGVLMLVYVISVLSGGACASFNAYLDRDIDSSLPRKSSRPVAAGIIKPNQAITFGLILSALAIFLAYYLNPYSSLIVLGGIVGIVAYTNIKRKTPFGIALSSLVNGFSSPLLGWVSASGSLNVTTMVLVAILTFWTLNHLLVISLTHADEYEFVKRPTVARVYGSRITTVLAIASIIVTVALTLSLPRLAELGLLYTSLMVIAGMLIIIANLKLVKDPRKKDFVRAFRLSRVYVFIFFLSMVADIISKRR